MLTDGNGRNLVVDRRGKTQIVLGGITLVLATILPNAILAGYVYGTLNNRVEANTRDIISIQTNRFTNIEGKLLTERIGRVEERTRRDIEEIKELLKEIREQVEHQ